MIRFALIISLTIFSLISLGQSNNERIKLMTVTYTGDSSLLSEKYEIDIVKKKIYYITPIANYLDIKNVKYRTRIKISKKKWKEITILINNIVFTKLAEIKEDNLLKTLYSNEKQKYLVEIETSNNEIKKYQIVNESESRQLNYLFKTIRETK